MDWDSGWVGEGLATLPAHEFLPAPIVASGPGLWLTLSALSSGGSLLSLCFSLVFPTLWCQSELSNYDHLCQDSFSFLCFS